MKPPYEINSDILKLLSEISIKLGEVKSSHLIQHSPELRKKNNIKTIQASLGIEGNTLSLEQVTAIFEGKRVLGPAKEILEVKNAISVYDALTSFKPNSIKSFLKAHQIMMGDLIPNPGKFRTGSVGIISGNKVTHVAPPGKRVSALIENLFTYLKTDKDPELIKSCVFHYELEFIHPFMDGNGRMGRLWQSVILGDSFPIFQYLPIETIIKERQAEYYRALGKCDKEGKSTQFIKFMFQVILEQLESIVSAPRANSVDFQARIEIAKSEFKMNEFDRADYLTIFKEISAPTASRDLKKAVDLKLLHKSGDKRLTVYRFI
jgi:Fic family protein